MRYRLLLPVLDDSTLFFALRLRQAMEDTPCDCDIGLIADISSLSERQLTENLPGGPDVLIQNNAFKSPANFDGYDAIVTSRMFKLLADMINRKAVRMFADRPLIISFQGGLDFTPDRGFENRRNADAVFVVPQTEVARFGDYAAENDFDWQHIDFGHPTFLRPDIDPNAAENRRDIYFFAQAVSPMTRRARVHIIEMLDLLARKNPDRTVWIKLRHLPGENSKHLHKEEFDYPGLMASSPTPLSSNLKYTACTMDEAIAEAAVGITCTSTAAIDLIRAGVPTQIYLDYIENYLDPLADPMRGLFETSGLIASLEEVLEQTTRAPEESWMHMMFCPNDLGARVLAAIETVREKRLSVGTIIPPF